MELTDLLGDQAEGTAQSIERLARAILRRSYGTNPFVRENEDDIVQQVLMISVEWARRVSDGEAQIRNTEAWVVRITLNTKNQLWRRLHKLRQPSEFEEVPEIPEPSSLSAPELMDLRSALARLDDECRALLVRFHALGETGDSIASALGITCGNLRVRLHRCRKRLLALHDNLSPTAA